MRFHLKEINKMTKPGKIKGWGRVVVSGDVR